jgi:Ca2+-binding RTX toxin-like protein
MAYIFGTNGNDTLNGGSLIDRIFGGLGNDVMRGFGGNDLLYGARGNDIMSGGDGNDELFGGAGSDRIFGGAGRDRISGGDGYRFFTSEDGVIDALYGDAGSDIVSLGRNDLAFGGNGAGDVDTLSIFSDDARLYTVNLFGIGGQALTTFGIGTARAAQFEQADVLVFNATAGSRIIGTNGADDLGMETADTASTTGIRIDGLGGDDRISGSGDNDVLVGGLGDDVIEGDDGADLMLGNAGADAFVYRIASSFGSFREPPLDRISDFEAGVDTLYFDVGRFVDRPFAATLLSFGANATSPIDQIQFLYNRATGVVSIDYNGRASEGAEVVAVLLNKPNLTASDIHLEFNL